MKNKTKIMVESNANNLRQRAEDQLRKEQSKRVVWNSKAELDRLLHELQVQEIEVKLQNEELQAANTVAVKAAEKYSKFYDFAPAGYFTISEKGEILELNLRAAEMLGKERTQLINRRLGLFISAQTRPVYNQFLERVFKSDNKETCKLVLSGNQEELVDVFITGIFVQKGGDCFVTMVDVSDKSNALKKLKPKNLRNFLPGELTFYKILSNSDLL